MTSVLPAVNAGVVDRSLPYYHQLDESVLNSCLAFFPDAPRVAGCYRLDKHPDELFIHFAGQPKPWRGWTPAAFRHFDRYVSVAEFAVSQGWRIPGGIPYCLKRKYRTWCGLLRQAVSLKYKLQKNGEKSLFLRLKYKYNQLYLKYNYKSNLACLNHYNSKY